MRDHNNRSIATLGDAMLNWRAELRAEGIERRPSNGNADRGYIEQPGEGTADKPPPSVPRVPPHSQRPQSEAPLVLRRPVTSLTPAPPPPERETRIMPSVPPPIEREETRQIRAALESAAPKPTPLPPPSEKPTEAPSQNLVKLERPSSAAHPPNPSGRRRYRHYSDEEIAEVVRKVAATGNQSKVADEMDISKSMVSIWCRGAAEMKGGKRGAKPPAHKGGVGDPFPLEYRDDLSRKIIAYGRGGGSHWSKKSGVSEATLSLWKLDFLKRNPDAGPASSGSTMVSSGPVSKPVGSKPNGAASAPAPLSGFLTGLDEYIAQLVDARVEAKLVEILKTKSLMELMRQ